MKINKNFLQTAIFVIIYLFGIYYWTQPLHERNLPYGEYDAMSHFEVADFMSYHDSSFIDLPPYIDVRYGRDNRYKPHTLWYPPTFHSSLGVMQVLGGDRIISVYLLNTILASFIIITLYFVINRLFGFYPAILSSLLIIFSPRDFFPFLWGQWPERFAYSFIPIILYCFYQYLMSLRKNSAKPIYLYMTGLFLIINFLVHPMVFFHSGVGLFVFYVLFLIKTKKFYFNIKHILISLAIIVGIFLLFPIQTFNLFPSFMKQTDTDVNQGYDFSRIFKWSLDPKDYEGSVPAMYFSFSDMHGIWTLPFLIIGIIILVLRRKFPDILLLSWLISLYLVLHRDVIGKSIFIHRSLSATAHIFAPLTAIGAVYLTNLIKIPKPFSRYLKYSIIALFVFLAFFVNMNFSSQFINRDTYNPYSQAGILTSINQDEYNAATWFAENVPLSENITVLGIPHEQPYVSATVKKVKWFAAVSQHVTRFFELRENKSEVLKNQYIVVDYSFLEQVNDRASIALLQEFEKSVLSNHSLKYDSPNIKVYRYEE